MVAMVAMVVLTLQARDAEREEVAVSRQQARYDAMSPGRRRMSSLRVYICMCVACAPQ